MLVVFELHVRMICPLILVGRNSKTCSWSEICWEKRLTTHTPQFLGLPTGVWPTGGGYERAGEDIVIGFVDSGIYPHHPSFTTHNTEPYGPVSRYRGKCEVDPDTKKSFCNGKIIGAQHFAQAAIAAGAFNPSIDFDSPLDGDGHGRLGPLSFFINFFTWK